MKKNLLVALAALSVAPMALAEEQKPWEVSAELGVIATSGNTETTSVQAKVEAKQYLQKFHNHYIVNGLFKRDQMTNEDGSKEKEKTAEKYFASAKSAYQLEYPNSNVFGYISHADDKFGSYREYSTVAFGYGTRLFETDTMKLDAEIGPGYFRGKRVLENDMTQVEDGLMVRAAAAYHWQFTDTAEFNQTLSIESGSDNTRTIAESSVSTRISGAMQLKVGINIANDSRVAAGKEKTDTLSYVNLVYSF